MLYTTGWLSSIDLLSLLAVPVQAVLRAFYENGLQASVLAFSAVRIQVVLLLFRRVVLLCALQITAMLWGAAFPPLPFTALLSCSEAHSHVGEAGPMEDTHAVDSQLWVFNHDRQQY